MEKMEKIGKKLGKNKLLSVTCPRLIDLILVDFFKFFRFFKNFFLTIYPEISRNKM